MIDLPTILHLWMHYPLQMMVLVLTIFYGAGLIALKRGFKRLVYPDSPELPSVSIVVSFHNERRHVEACLRHLLQQDYPREKLEIIAVDDRSTDGTGEALDELARQHPRLQVIHIDDLHPQFAPKKRAIDRAIRQANGEIILLTDADGRPGKQWARGMVRLFSRETGMVLGYAPYTTRAPFHRWIHKILALEYFSHAAVAAATTGLGYPVTCVGTNLAYRRRVFLQLNGFGPFRHIHTGDDDLFLQRVRDETRWKIRYAVDPETFVWNFPPGSFTQFYHQRLRYASKGFYYPAKVTAILIGYYFLNVLLFLGTPFAVISGQPLWPLLLAIFLKGMGEWRFLYSACRRFSSCAILKYFPLAFILHVPYVVYFGLLGQFQKFQWGSRPK
ncbi:MAG: glycosyltransferase [Calditrichaeota bacterium]|nr:glycosyltransferase [Calditrichota bacterium]